MHEFVVSSTVQGQAGRQLAGTQQRATYTLANQTYLKPFIYAVAWRLEHRTVNRETPGSTPLAVEVWTISNTPHCLGSLRCIHEYLATGSGGHVNEVFAQ